MTIKEMEQRSGLQRANIRFYEEEGLLCPQRLENGYRNYSDSDLQQLRRIRLLRTLGLGLEEELRMEPLGLEGLSMLSDPCALLPDPAVEDSFRSDRLQ